MKPQVSVAEILKTPTLIKIFAFVLVSLTFFYLGKHWSDSDGFLYNNLIFFNSRQTPSVSLSPNVDKTYDITSLIAQTPTPTPSPSLPPPPLHRPPSPPPPPPPSGPRNFGIVDENGAMTSDFEVGEFDPDLVEDWGIGSDNGTDESKLSNSDGSGSVSSSRFRIKKYLMCPDGMREYIPCLDNVNAIKRLHSTERGERFERHCPEKENQLSCLVPPPKGYKPPIPWPRSRDEVYITS